MTGSPISMMSDDNMLLTASSRRREQDREAPGEIQFIKSSCVSSNNNKKLEQNRIFEDLLIGRRHETHEKKNNYQQERQVSHGGSDREIRNSDRFPNSIDQVLMQIRTKKQSIQAIVGPSGSIRGHKNCVKKNIETIVSTISSRSNKPDDLACDDSDTCVAYVTSLGVVRKTYEACRLLKSILYRNLIYYEERDIYLNYQYGIELKRRCGKNFVLPAIFLNGKFIGGIDIVEQLNETGDISTLMADFKMSSAQLDTCSWCGNARFIPCIKCHGSTKSTIQHYPNDSIVLKCSKCIDGLVQCPKCLETMKHWRQKTH